MNPPHQWAMNQRPDTPLEKLLLVVLAGCYGSEHGGCYPSLQFLCSMAVCSRRGAINAISSLERQGFLTTHKEAGKVTRYRLNLTAGSEREAAA